MLDIDTYDNCAKIKVIGVGCGGCKAVDTMAEYGLDGIEFILVNTDKHALANCKTPIKILLENTRGFGAGGRPEIGTNAAEESRKKISQVIDGADMVIIIAGMGRGTGTGSAPVVAAIAKSKGMLTVGIATKPYLFEGRKIMKRALEGIYKLKDNIDTLIVVSNQRLLENADKPHDGITSLFKKSDEILRQAAQSVTNIITKPSLVGLDFVNISAIMSDKGFACIGTGRASGKNKFEEAAMNAIKDSLIEPFFKGKANVLLNIVFGKNSSLFDINKVACSISKILDINDSKIIFGAYGDDDLEDEVIITVITIGIELEKNSKNFAYFEPTSDKEIDIPSTPFWALGNRKKPKDL